jgi:FkbM family methyltransferase
MKSWLRKVRRVQLINLPVRVCIRAGFRAFSELRLRWPVSGPVEITYEGLRFKLLSHADDGFAQRLYYGIAYQGSHVLAITDAFARWSRAILDIGANTGIHAIIVAKRNPSSTIIAIEPYPPNYDRMESNLALNGIVNVIPKKVALGASRGSVEFFAPADGRITDVSSVVEGHGERIYGEQIHWEKIPVPQVALDDLLDEIESIGFLKCDVEAYEMEVFRGAATFFARHRPTFIVEITLNPDSVAFFNKFASDHSYTMYFVSGEGLIKLDQIYVFASFADFVFSQYCHPETFVPVCDFESFVECAWRVTQSPG